MEKHHWKNLTDQNYFGCYCLLKLGPVETGKVRTSGTSGGGGHDTATGTGEIGRAHV